MAVLVASAQTWSPFTQHLPMEPLRTTWSVGGLELHLELSSSSLPSSSSLSKPKLRLPVLSTPAPVCRFDPFADDDEPPKLRSQPLQQLPENIPPPALSRARTPAPLSISVPTGRRRAPSFSAGSGVRLSSLAGRTLSPSVSVTTSPSPTSTSSFSASPAPSLSRPRLIPTTHSTPTPAPTVPGAPSPFMARHYPTPDARSRLLARTLLHRINVVGRPRSACSSPCVDGYEAPNGARAYVPSRLSECVVVA